MVEVTESNPRFFKEINLKLKEMQGVVGKVGWFESSQYPNGTPVAYVAAIQEFGNTNGVPIPPRPFMRPAAIQTEKEVAELAAKGAAAILEGQATPMEVMKAITQVVENKVADNIATLTSPPLSKLTLAIRKYKQEHPNVEMTGSLVGKIAGMLNAGEITTSGVSTKPLNDTGLMMAALTSQVENDSI